MGHRNHIISYLRRRFLADMPRRCLMAAENDGTVALWGKGGRVCRFEKMSNLVHFCRRYDIEATMAQPDKA